MENTLIFNRQEYRTGIAEVMGLNPAGASSRLSLQVHKLLHNCEYHFHLYSLSVLHIHIIYII